MKFFILWGAIGIVLMGVIYWLGQTYFGSNDNGLQISNVNNRSQVEIGKLDGHQKRIGARVVAFPFYDPTKSRVRA